MKYIIKEVGYLQYIEAIHDADAQWCGYLVFNTYTEAKKDLRDTFQTVVKDYRDALNRLSKERKSNVRRYDDN